MVENIGLSIFPKFSCLHGSRVENNEEKQEDDKEPSFPSQVKSHALECMPYLSIF